MPEHSRGAEPEMAESLCPPARSGSQELTFSDETPKGPELWAVFAVTDERASQYMEQLPDRGRDGKVPARMVSSGHRSYIAELNPNSMNPAEEDVVQVTSENGLAFQSPPQEEAVTQASEGGLVVQFEGLKVEDERLRGWLPVMTPSATNKKTEDSGVALVRRSSSLERRLERMAPLDWEIPCQELIIGQTVGAGSFGTVHRADWRGSVSFLLINLLQLLLTRSYKCFQVVFCNVLFQGCKGYVRP